MSEIQEPEMSISSLSGKHVQVQRFNRQIQSITTMPRSRYLLFGGSLMAISLVFLPWFELNVVMKTGVTAVPFNPLSLYLRDLGYSRLRFLPVEITTLLLLSGCVAPGIICSIWVCKRIRTWGQRIGAVIFSLWLLFFTWLGFYTTSRLTIPNIASRYHSFAITGQLQAVSGWYLFLITVTLLWLGLLTLWIELLTNRQMILEPTLQRQSLLNYSGAIMLTAGLVTWFTGYYGIYWLLPANCPYTPLFGSAMCNNRLSAGTGFNYFLDQMVSSGFHFNRLAYGINVLINWGVGILIVSGGIAFIISVWLRNSTRIEIRGGFVWLLMICSLSLATYLGCSQLGNIYSDSNEVWTAGLPVTVVGIGLIVVGWLMRLRTTMVSVPQQVPQL